MFVYSFNTVASIVCVCVEGSLGLWSLYFALLCVLSSFAIIPQEKKELVAF